MKRSLLVNSTLNKQIQRFWFLLTVLTALLYGIYSEMIINSRMDCYERTPSHCYHFQHHYNCRVQQPANGSYWFAISIALLEHSMWVQENLLLGKSLLSSYYSTELFCALRSVKNYTKIVR